MSGLGKVEEGDHAAALFREIWVADFEFRADPGEHPWPVCMVAEEIKTRRVIRLWRNDLLALDRAPFDVGPDALFIAYYATAEFGCFLELSWQLPENVLDLYVEHRVETNGEKTLCGNGLLGALALRGVAHLDAGEKESMRRLILDQQQWTDEEKRKILDYCSSDVTGTVALFSKMVPSIDWPRALLRGRYMKAVARMERTGVPIDAALHRRMVANWDDLKIDLIASVDVDFGVYDGTTFKADRFADFLSARRIAWPKHPTGAMKLDDDTFREQTRRWPELQGLYELRVTLGRLRLTDLEVGSDSRNRCLLSPFRAETGRNQPSTTKFIFGPARWLRGLIRPPQGYGLAYIDFVSQKIGIAAALSGDERMAEGYLTGDPYTAFAKAARLVPPDATKQSHKAVRAVQGGCARYQLRDGAGSHGNASGYHTGGSKGITPSSQGDLQALLAVDWRHGVVGDADQQNANRLRLAPTCWARCESPVIDEFPNASQRGGDDADCCDCGHRGRY